MRPLAESERIGELIRLMDEVDDNLDTNNWDTVEIRKIRYIGSSHVVSDSRSIFEFDFDDVRIIRSALEAALKGGGDERP